MVSDYCTLYTVQCTVKFICLADFMFFCTLHRIEKELGFFSSCPNWDSHHTPSPARRRVSFPPSFGSEGGGGAHSPVCEGVTLRSSCDRVKWPYGVKKISIKWLWPVKVTLKVIKRRLKVFCWSSDGVPLKWNKKKLPSLQFVITDQMSLLSPFNLNDRSIPLRRSQKTVDIRVFLNFCLLKEGSGSV